MLATRPINKISLTRNVLLGEYLERLAVYLEIVLCIQECSLRSAAMHSDCDSVAV